MDDPDSELVRVLVETFEPLVIRLQIAEHVEDEPHGGIPGVIVAEFDADALDTVQECRR
jgi:hypothetical protein